MTHGIRLHTEIGNLDNFEQNHTTFSNSAEPANADAAVLDGVAKAPASDRAQLFRAEQSYNRDLGMQVHALQALVSIYPSENDSREKVQAILLESLLLVRSEKFRDVDAAIAHLLENAGSDSQSTWQQFTQTELGKGCLAFLHQSQRGVTRESLVVLTGIAEQLLPPPAYLGRIMGLGGLVSAFAHGNISKWAEFSGEMFHLGRDLLQASQGVLHRLHQGFQYTLTHPLTQMVCDWESYLFSQNPTSQSEAERNQVAEFLMGMVNSRAPELAEATMQGSLGQRVGLREVENSLRRSSLIFVESSGDFLSTLSNYAASVFSGYLNYRLSATPFSRYGLLLSAVTGAGNGLVQGGVQLMHQLGGMSSQQISENAGSLAWQLAKSMLIGVGSSLGEHGVGHVLHGLPIAHPLLKIFTAAAGFALGDVGAELLTTEALDRIGVALHLQEDQILQARGIYNFASNAIEEVGLSNHLTPLGLLHCRALGAAAGAGVAVNNPPLPPLLRGESSEPSLPRGERVGESVTSEAREIPLSRKPCGFSSPLQGGGRSTSLPVYQSTSSPIYAYASSADPVLEFLGQAPNDMDPVAAHIARIEGTQRNLFIQNDLGVGAAGPQSVELSDFQRYQNAIRPRLAILQDVSSATEEELGALTEQEVFLRQSYLEALQRINRDYQEWILEVNKNSDEISAEQKKSLEHFLPFYARVALAHFGREMPRQVGYLEWVFEVAYSQIPPDPPLSKGEIRRTLIRFLSSQPERHGIGFHSEARKLFAPVRGIEEIKTRLGREAYSRFRKDMMLKLAARGDGLFARYRNSTRILDLLHAYMDEALERNGANASLAFDASLYREALRKDLGNPYSLEVQKIFLSLLNLSESEMEAQLWREGEIYKKLDAKNWKMLELPAVAFVQAKTAEAHGSFLGRVFGLAVAGVLKLITEANLGFKGNTIGAWGRHAPDDFRFVQGLHTLVTGEWYRFALRSDAAMQTGMQGIVDPHEYMRRFHSSDEYPFSPNEAKELVVPVPELFWGIPFENLTLAEVVQKYLEVFQVSDRDLANACLVEKRDGRQEALDPATLANYRKGEVHLVQRSTLKALALALSGNNEELRAQLEQFFFFLKYKNYFESNFNVYRRSDAAESSADGRVNLETPHPSQYPVVLQKLTQPLHRVPSTQRLNLHKEPLASINDWFDYLIALEDRLLEYRATGAQQVLVRNHEGLLKLLLNGVDRSSLKVTSEEGRSFVNVDISMLQARLQGLIDSHLDHCSEAYEHASAQTVVPEKRIQELKSFYRDLALLGEDLLLYHRPQSQLKLGEAVVDYEIYPPTQGFLQGVKIVSQSSESEAGQAFQVQVAVMDLIENARALLNEQKWKNGQALTKEERDFFRGKDKGAELSAENLKRLIHLRIARELAVQKALVARADFAYWRDYLQKEFAELTAGQAAMLARLDAELEEKSYVWTKKFEDFHDALLHRLVKKRTANSALAVPAGWAMIDPVDPSTLQAQNLSEDRFAEMVFFVYLVQFGNVEKEISYHLDRIEAIIREGFPRYPHLDNEESRLKIHAQVARLLEAHAQRRPWISSASAIPTQTSPNPFAFREHPIAYLLESFSVEERPPLDASLARLFLQLCENQRTREGRALSEEALEQNLEAALRQFSRLGFAREGWSVATLQAGASKLYLHFARHLANIESLATHLSPLVEDLKTRGGLLDVDKVFQQIFLSQVNSLLLDTSPKTAQEVVQEWWEQNKNRLGDYGFVQASLTEGILQNYYARIWKVLQFRVAALLPAFDKISEKSRTMEDNFKKLFLDEFQLMVSEELLADDLFDLKDGEAVLRWLEALGSLNLVMDQPGRSARDLQSNTQDVMAALEVLDKPMVSMVAPVDSVVPIDSVPPIAPVVEETRIPKVFQDLLALAEINLGDSKISLEQALERLKTLLLEKDLNYHLRAELTRVLSEAEGLDQKNIVLANFYIRRREAIQKLPSLQEADERRAKEYTAYYYWCLIEGVKDDFSSLGSLLEYKIKRGIIPTTPIRRKIVAEEQEFREAAIQYQRAGFSEEQCCSYLNKRNLYVFTRHRSELFKGELVELRINMLVHVVFNDIPWVREQCTKDSIPWSLNVISKCVEMFLESEVHSSVAQKINRILDTYQVSSQATPDGRVHAIEHLVGALSLCLFGHEEQVREAFELDSHKKEKLKNPMSVALQAVAGALEGEVIGKQALEIPDEDLRLFPPLVFYFVGLLQQVVPESEYDKLTDVAKETHGEITRVYNLQKHSRLDLRAYFEKRVLEIYMKSQARILQLCDWQAFIEKECAEDFLLLTAEDLNQIEHQLDGEYEEQNELLLQAGIGVLSAQQKMDYRNTARFIKKIFKIRSYFAENESDYAVRMRAIIAEDNEIIIRSTAALIKRGKTRADKLILYYLCIRRELLELPRKTEVTVDPIVPSDSDASNQETLSEMVNAVLHYGAAGELKGRINFALQQFIAGTLVGKDFFEIFLPSLLSQWSEDIQACLQRAKEGAVAIGTALGDEEQQRKNLPPEFQYYASLIPVERKADEVAENIPLSFACYRDMALSSHQGTAGSEKFLERFYLLKRKIGIDATVALDAAIREAAPEMLKRFSFRKLVEEHCEELKPFIEGALVNLDNNHKKDLAKFKSKHRLSRSCSAMINAILAIIESRENSESLLIGLEAINNIQTSLGAVAIEKDAEQVTEKFVKLYLEHRQAILLLPPKSPLSLAQQKMQKDLSDGLFNALMNDFTRRAYFEKLKSQFGFTALDLIKVSIQELGWEEKEEPMPWQDYLLRLSVNEGFAIEFLQALEGVRTKMRNTADLDEWAAQWFWVRHFQQK
ncbi:MAG: hypothetical protein HQM15_07960 [Deltaproteobacteria bacterium]|nr:hypothetical protein [Deltaproteobacteria bacterium]